MSIGKQIDRLSERVSITDEGVDRKQARQIARKYSAGNAYGQ
jgi:hypothetical protein